MKNFKIGTKILIIVLSISLLSLFTIATLSYIEMLNLTKYSTDANAQLGASSSQLSKTALKDQAEEYIAKIVNGQTLKSDAVLSKVQNEVISASQYLTSLYQNKNNFIGKDVPFPDLTENKVASSKYMLPNGVENTSAIQNEVRLLSNTEYLFAPFLNQDTTMNNIYLGTKSGVSFRYSRSNAFDKTYDHRERDWYKQAMEKPNEIIWLDTYIDSYGAIGITCCTTFQNELGEIQGVVASDIGLKEVQDDILSMKIGKTGFAFLTDQNGTILAHPNYQEEGFDTTPLKNKNADYYDVINEMLRKTEGLVSAKIAKNDTYIAYSTLPTTKWKLGIAVDEDEIIAPALASEKTINEYTESALTNINNTLQIILLNFAATLAITTMLVFLVGYLLSKTITKPLKKLVHSAISIGQGNLDAKVEIKGKDEIAELGESFNKMSDNLKGYIENLSKVTAEKERIGAELDVANKIQSSMLPYIFPAFPERDEFDIHASMLAAKEVGGDFYDFFLVDDTHLAIVIADVSGKGVPAALFMVVTKTLIKNYTLLKLSPKEIFENVNQRLCEGNDANMFVTSFMGIIDLENGEFNYVNAGHNPPCICRKDDTFTFLETDADFVLAGMEDIPYTQSKIALQDGDILYLYTDGVPEATDKDDLLYGEDKMIESLNKHKNESLDQLLVNVKKDIDAFVKDAEQFDDITMLAFQAKHFVKK